MGNVSKAGVDEAFQNQVREMLKPGTSALFMVVEQMTTDKAMDALSKYGGTVLKTSLSKEAEKQLQDALHGEQGDRLTSDQPAESVQRSALN